MSFVLFLLSSPSRLSLVSVVFDFNASLSDAASASLNSLTVEMNDVHHLYVIWFVFVNCSQRKYIPLHGTMFIAKARLPTLHPSCL